MHSGDANRATLMGKEIVPTDFGIATQRIIEAPAIIWKPIEIAPKDADGAVEDWLVLYDQSRHIGSIVQGRWVKFNDLGDGGWQCIQNHQVNPTHWCEPQPPSE